jgi:hypothetical protein
MIQQLVRSITTVASFAVHVWRLYITGCVGLRGTGNWIDNAHTYRNLKPP